MSARHLARTNTLVILLGMLLVGTIVWMVRIEATQHALDEQLIQHAMRYTHTADAASAGSDSFAVHPVFLQVQAPDGTITARSANLLSARLPSDASDLQRARAGEAWFASVSVEGHTLRMYHLPWYPAGAASSGGVGLVQAAAPVDQTMPDQSDLAALGLGAAIATIIASVAGLLLARLAFRPVQQLADTIEGIQSTTDLSRRVRIPASSAPREVQRVAVAFNAMLERLQVSSRELQRTLDVQRQFVADASHQLRTPLTSLQGNVHLLTRLCAEDCPTAFDEQHGEVLADVQTEAERMTRLVQDLLCLARADAHQHLELAPVDIAPLIQAACRTARGLSETVTVELGDVPEGCVILANAERFIELLAILLDNAIRYSPPFERVEVRARRLRRGTAAGVLVEIADHGPGIPVEERERIFERFYRSRTAGYREGVGLGLAVARWIATEHHAELTVMDNTPVGSVFCLWLVSVGGAEPSGRDRS